VSDTGREIASQPDTWDRALRMKAEALAAPGERVLVLGCGTSWFMAQCLAELRESAGLGETDAVCASEYQPRRKYDRIVAITRSGTTTEVIEALERAPSGTHQVVVTGVPVEFGDTRILLDFADERSVVQTRFPTTVLALARSSFGEDMSHLVDDGRKALDADLPTDPAGIDHVVFLGTGWTVGLANEAALKVREAAQAWSESYPGMDFRHGPVAVAGPRSLVWSFGPVPESLDDAARAAGATAYRNNLDPIAQLVLAQRFAVALASHRGLDPDHPRQLTRSVVL